MKRKKTMFHMIRNCVFDGNDDVKYKSKFT